MSEAANKARTIGIVIAAAAVVLTVLVKAIWR
jgi:hypothetical protein